MEILQHYYTSYTNRETGSAGFQAKAMSPGIPFNIQTIIARLIAYRIPPTLDEHALDTHPIALRYSYQDAQQSIFLCSQSNGNDENGRPGNFFAHTLVMEPTIFSSIPPILYWKSPFWCTRDPESRSNIASLPIIEEFEAVPAPLDVEPVWNFLAQRNRQELLYKLMCAVIHSSKTQRRIVILDTTENIVWWIVAVSCYLPPAYRPLLTFATYHHDPYQAQFLITGTTPDSSFRDSAEEHLSFFVLNAITGTTSTVEPSVYAKLVAESAQLDSYEANVVSLFTTSYVQRLAPTAIDEQLDLLALYAGIHSGQRQGPLTEQEIQAVHAALTTLEEWEVKQEDIDELKTLRPILWEAYKAQEEIALLIEHDRVAALLRKHKIPTEEIVEDELYYFTELLMRGATNEKVLASFEKLKQSYGEGSVAKILNRPKYLNKVHQLLVRKASEHGLQNIWRYLGAFIKPSEASQQFLLVSLSMIDDLIRNERVAEKQVLLQTMWQAMKGCEQDWLRLAVKQHNAISKDVLEAFYYYFASALDLAQRTSYREIVYTVDSGVTKYEIQQDITNAGSTKALAVLEAWVHYGSTVRYDRSKLVQFALNKLKRISSPEQWSGFAPDILMNSTFAPLPEVLEREIVLLVLSQATLSQFSDSSLPLYKKYVDYEGVSDDTKMRISAILAITTGMLHEQLAQQLYAYTKTLSLQEYGEVVARCVPEFFCHPFTYETHHNIVAALLTWKYGYTNADSFWSIYWQVFTNMLLLPTAAEQAAEFLNFWFTTTPDQFKQTYVVQYFLFTLPAILSNLQKQRGFQETLQRLNGVTSHYPWHSAVQELLVERKNVLAVFGQSMFSQLQRRLVTSSNVKEAQEAQTREQQEFEMKMIRLFKDKKAFEYHHKLAEVYTMYSHKQFWAMYWKQFIELFVSHDIDFTLALLSFWFNDSFDVLGDAPYIAQEFFLGLSEALEEAKKEKGFREAVRNLQEKASRHKQEYSSLYLMIKPYLL